MRRTLNKNNLTTLSHNIFAGMQRLRIMYVPTDPIAVFPAMTSQRDVTAGIRHVGTWSVAGDNWTTCRNDGLSYMHHVE